MREEPKALQIYRHFKGNYYQIVDIAKHSETGERLVIYRSLFGEDHVCARPLLMFMSEVDHEKYPDVKQKWRFALVTGQLKKATEEEGSPKEVVPEEEDTTKEETLREEAPEEVPEDEEKPEEEVPENDFLDKFLEKK